MITGKTKFSKSKKLVKPVPLPVLQNEKLFYSSDLEHDSVKRISLMDDFINVNILSTFTMHLTYEEFFGMVDTLNGIREVVVEEFIKEGKKMEKEKEYAERK